MLDRQTEAGGAHVEREEDPPVDFISFYSSARLQLQGLKTIRKPNLNKKLTDDSDWEEMHQYIFYT